MERTQVHKGEYSVNMEADIRVMCLQVKKPQGLSTKIRRPETGVDDLSLRAFKRNQSCQHPDFELLSS